MDIVFADRTCAMALVVESLLYGVIKDVLSKQEDHYGDWLCSLKESHDEWQK